MNKQIYRLLVALMILPCLGSCLTTDLHSTQSVFDVSDIVVPADTLVRFGTGTGTVSAYLPVRSAETWSASVVDPSLSPWIRLERNVCSNPGGVELTSGVSIVCECNDSYESRTATVRFFTSQGAVRDVAVTQKAKVDRISVDGGTSYSLDAESDSPVKIKLQSNAQWSVALDSSSTLGLSSVSPAEGCGDEVVTIDVNPNYDCTREGVALVNFCIEDGDTVTVSVTRASNVPFISANQVDLRQYRMPADTAGVLCFNCNMEWKAEVVECDIKDFSLSAAAGPAGMSTELPFTMSANDGQRNLSARIRLSLCSDSAKSVELAVVQRAGFSLNVDFTTVVSEATCPLQSAGEQYPPIPFTGKDAESLNNSGGDPYVYVFTDGETRYEFEIKNAQFNCFSNYAAGAEPNGYLRLGRGYLKFPAVEGYRLAYVEFTTASSNKRYGISSDPEGMDMVGRETTYTSKDMTASWDLETTEYGKSYYEIVSVTASRQKNLILLYVK